MAYFLTIPDQATAIKAIDGKNSNGQGNLMRELERLPLAISERGRPRYMDHIHLSRFDETDFVQWYGRCADGWHRPIGRVMQIVEAHRKNSSHV